jgi:hypothetical protein
MNVNAVLHVVILLLSSGAMAIGVAVMAGMLVPPTLPQQFRIPVGAVVFLYGAYRLVITFVRQSEARRNEIR